MYNIVILQYDYGQFSPPIFVLKGKEKAKGKNSLKLY